MLYEFLLCGLNLPLVASSSCSG